MRAVVTVIIAILITVISLGCIQHVEQQAEFDFSRYFPLNSGDSFVWSGPLGRCEVGSSVENLFTFTFYDSLGNITRWHDFRLLTGSVRLENIIIPSDSIYSVHFIPALQFGAWSDLTGDTTLIEAVEIRNDLDNTHARVMVGCEILGVEKVTTPAGDFDNCVKVGVTYASLEGYTPSFLNGESAWWFAKDVGLVKYSTAHGAGNLLNAVIDGVNIP